MWLRSRVACVFKPCQNNGQVVPTEFDVVDTQAAGVDECCRDCDAEPGHKGGAGGHEMDGTLPATRNGNEGTGTGDDNGAGTPVVGNDSLDGTHVHTRSYFATSCYHLSQDGKTVRTKEEGPF